MTFKLSVGFVLMRPSIAAALVMLLAALCVPVPRAHAGDDGLSCAGLEPGPARTITRILDGETVALDDGRELRLIGALAPRAGDVGAEPGAWPAEIATTAELRALALGKTVELAFEGERSDRYGRLQAQAYVRDGGERRWVQGHPLGQGLARAYVQAGSRACAEALLGAERGAREAGRGLWAEAAYGIRSADSPTQLAGYRSTFQLIEGRIARVAQVRGVVYLNFSRDWRHGLSASLRRDDRALLGVGAADAPKALEGRRVRVRGWLEQRQSLAIDLSAAGLLEVLDEGRPGSPGRVEGRDAQAPPRAPETKPPGLIETGR